MGVSGSGDFDLIINGGEPFINRLAELRSATEAYTKALSDLNLGKEAVAARDEAGRALSEAKSQREAAMAALEKEVTQAKESLNTWVEETKAKTMAAYDEANRLVADAKANQEAAVAAKEASMKTLSDAKVEAASLVQDTRAAVDDLLTRANIEAAAIVSKAKDLDEAARKALVDAEAAKIRYDTAMEQIKSVAVSVS